MAELLKPQFNLLTNFFTLKTSPQIQYILSLLTLTRHVTLDQCMTNEAPICSFLFLAKVPFRAKGFAKICSVYFN